jgi:chemotaxis protein MotB
MTDLNNQIEEQSSGETQSWLMTYADMMTLLFAFFVLLYSMSSPDPVKVSQMQEAVAKDKGLTADDSESVREELKSQSEIHEEFKDIVEDLNLEDVASVTHDQRGAAIELNGDFCFASGSTDLHETLVELLDNVAERLLSNKNDYRQVIVEGHTDNEPIPGKLRLKYPTNWELSASRASIVVNYLINKSVMSGRLVASGYADRWPVEASWHDVRSGKLDENLIASFNNTTEQKRKNRRIKIIFSKN